MTPEKLAEIEKLEAAATPGEWRHLMLRADVRDLFAALREAWRERDEARAVLDVANAFHDVAVKERDYERVVCNRLTKERDDARAALRMLWEEATDPTRCEGSGVYFSEPCRAAVKAVLGEIP